MKPEYLALVAVVTQALVGVGLAVWKEPPTWVRVSAAAVIFLGAIVGGVASIGISNEGTALTTGADSFCYLVVSAGAPPTFPVVFKSGEYPLYGVEMRIVNLIEPFRPLPHSSTSFDLGLNLLLRDFAIGESAKEIPFPLRKVTARRSMFSSMPGTDFGLKTCGCDWSMAIGKGPF
jgi:hypothetical protein